MKVGVNVAVIDNGRVLLTKRKDFEVWCLPGGHVEAEESVAQAAVRETVEETGLEVRLTRLVGIYSIPPTKAWCNLIILFTAESIGGTLKAEESEVLEAGYFYPDEIPENLLWGHRQRIRDALNRYGGGVVRLQNVPFDQVMSRQALYALREESGLSGQEFYGQYFGWADPASDRLETGK
ncbi:MAG: NUDIX domain-containing protein [Chloroflexi bacterium]|nr:NUDIX domain-containing protein [Chloroflexota bacterium]MCI0579833.1 NUDIX domain-containing protein [Chloroflexota bacterium]MCI0646759.1 NUDIX domain-containing protein [Chloroflexota bacterium]MCI0728982.1 NUDIX domain-containing protein [Chloroflexota bacterium]